MLNLPLMVWLSKGRKNGNARLLQAGLVLVLLLCSSGFAQNASNSKVERVVIGKNGELRSNSIDPNKRKFTYDNGGAFTCNLSVRAIRQAQGMDDPCKEKQVRDFIWDHLQAQRRGHIQITYVSIDSGTREFFFIEPDKDGNWKVSWWTIGYSALPPGSSKVDPKRILSAEKVARAKDGEWFIRFKDLDGVNFLNMPSVLHDN